MELLIATFIGAIMGCGARLILTPNNVAVLQEKEATMKCSSDSSKTLVWRTQSSKDSVGYITIYTGNKLHADFQSLYRIFVVKQGEVDLIIIRANEETAGIYVCEEYGSGPDYASAELIVLASDPLCKKENWKNDDGGMKQEHIRFVCRLRYMGNWAPVMQWKQVSGTEQASKLLTEDVTNILRNNTVESALVVRDGQHYSVVKYICITRFTKSYRLNMSNTATNIPDYLHTWEYDMQSNTTGVSKPDENTNLPVFSAVIAGLLVVAVGLTVYVVYMKRMRPYEEHENPTIEANATAARRALYDESDYVDMERTPTSGNCCSSEEYYAGLDEPELTEPNLYVTLDKIQEPSMSTKPSSEKTDLEY